MFFRYPKEFRIDKDCSFTFNTTRICENTPIDLSVEVSKLGFSASKPNAVILVNENEIYEGISASSLVHFPINAPILLTDGNTLSKNTLKEILHLSPKGYKGTQIFLVGNLSENISSQLKRAGLSTHHISGKNHYETACKILEFRPDFKNILIISGEDYNEGIITSFWSAHNGDPILFVEENNIPPCTLDKIKSIPNVNVYIIGLESTISKSIDNTISKLPNVKFSARITGRNPYELAVNFSKYKSPNGDFGWARTDRNGHAFTFATLNNAKSIIPSVIFAHMGKHTPLLLIESNFIPSVVYNYIKEIKPVEKKMPYPPFMHGFVLGCQNSISCDIQAELEKLMSVGHHM